MKKFQKSLSLEKMEKLSNGTLRVYIQAHKKVCPFHSGKRKCHPLSKAFNLVKLCWGHRLVNWPDACQCRPGMPLQRQLL